MSFARTFSSYFIVAALLSAMVSGAADASVACEPPEEAVSCPNCFAAFIMPDTQLYTTARRNTQSGKPYRLGAGPNGEDLNGQAMFDEEGGIHLQRMAEWVCENKAEFIEPSTGKSMPIELFVHLGDLVHFNEHDRSELRHCEADDMPDCENSCVNNECEWGRITAVFDILDACGMRYLTAPGNHDWTGFNRGSGSLESSNAYQFYFPDTVPAGSVQSVRAPWVASARCVAPDGCEPEHGRWYLGGGDDEIPEAQGGNAIPEMSRDIDMDGTGDGPVTDQFGRHRVGMLESAGGDDFLFLGLEFHTGLRFSTRWPRGIMDANPLTPTVVFNHQGITPLTPEFDELVAPNSQVFLILNGHELSITNREHTVTLPNGRTYTVPQLVRDHGGGQGGWNDIAVFDPDAGQVRVRSVKIDGDHDVMTADITNVGLQACDDVIGETIVAIPEILPRSDDNCPDDINPDQADTDGDGIGDACDLCPDLPNEDPADYDGDGIPNQCDPNPIHTGNDTDEDGLDDGVDNCIEIANPSQCDTDMDGYGNHCDGDFDNNDQVNFGDATNYWFPDYEAQQDSGRGTDMDCNGQINSGDWYLWVDQYETEEGEGVVRPGPSGLFCAGSVPCIDSERDGFPDHVDNCTEIKNEHQCDTDMDGYGNHCDGDFDNNGQVSSGDFTYYWIPDYEAQEDSGRGTDMDCNGSVSSGDYTVYWADQYDQGYPGPSGLACSSSCP